MERFEVQHEMKRPIRSKRVEVKLSEEEHQHLKDKNISNIARFLRESAMAALKNEDVQAPVFSKLDKEFVLELSRIGTNLNQISRAINTDLARDEPLNAVKLLHLLISIDEALKNLKETMSDDR